MNMGMLLYDLAAADPARRFSPYCWRIKMALSHKGLPYDTVPWRFTDKDVIAFSGQGFVPVLVDGGKVVSDSWNIAIYLEDHYPDRPSLFHGDGGRAITRFVNAWSFGVLAGGIVRLIVTDIFENIDEKDRDYFRKTREQRFGKSSGGDSRQPRYGRAFLSQDPGTRSHGAGRARLSRRRRHPPTRIISCLAVSSGPAASVRFRCS